MRVRRHTAAAVAMMVVAPLVALIGSTGAAVAGSSSGGASATSANCRAYATGTGMGSFCVGGGATAQTLRERFGKQPFDRCRYSEVPEGMDKPFNPSPDEGQWLLRKCLNYIDWDTVTGGQGRQVNVHLAYLPIDFDTTYEASPVGDFLWGDLERTTQFPVPYLRAQPTAVPRVGVPAFMTFRWIDPVTNRPVAQGPFAGEADGAPYVELDNPNGLQMRARALSVRVDPRQNDMDAVDCPTTDPRYDVDAGPAGEQPGSCSIVFPRTSATAQERMTDEDRQIARPLGKVYLVRVEVTWEVEYSRDGTDWTRLGGGQGEDGSLIQSTDQPVPVRESQAANLPPRFTMQ